MGFIASNFSAIVILISALISVGGWIRSAIKERSAYKRGYDDATNEINELSIKAFKDESHAIINGRLGSGVDAMDELLRQRIDKRD